MPKLTIGTVAAGAVLASAAALTIVVGLNSGSDDGKAAQDVAAATGTTKVLPVPAPKAAKLNPDPNSALCRVNPATPYCGVDSVRYAVKGSTLSAHDLWMPVLTKWGLTSDVDSCIDKPAQAGILCLVQGVRSDTKVTVLFKAAFEGQYSPANVKMQTDAIHAKAMVDIQKVTAVPAKAKILEASAARIAAIKSKADDWNTAHPMSSVNVLVER
jgi:hypothetical protein